MEQKVEVIREAEETSSLKDEYAKLRLAYM